MNFHCFLKLATFTCTLLVSLSSIGLAQSSQLEKALAIAPKQKDVDFDTPSGDDLKTCKIETIKEPPGFVVTDGGGRMLRLFTDNNSDNKLDQWSYFKNGIEVYRDVDSDFDSKTDQYRWLGSAGTRWGIDSNQDEKIDEWKFISAEEVAYEVFHAIRDQDLERFRCLMLRPEEFKSLELGRPIATEIQTRWKGAQKEFLEFCKSQNQISQSTEWVHSSNGLPAMVPVGASGNKQDIVVYDHASAVFKGSDYGQLAVGTIVQVDKGVWRLIELPELAEDGKPIGNGGAFFPMTPIGGETTAVGTDPIDQTLANKYSELEKIEKELADTDKAVEIARLEAAKAALLEEFYELTEPGEQKLNWLKNIADSVASAYQKERYPDGLEYLDGFVSRLKSADVEEGLDYIRWRAIYAKYGLAIEQGNSQERETAQDVLIEELTKFQNDYPSSSIAAEALSSLGIHYEISGESKQAIEWYQTAVKRFADTDFGKRAAGALVRLEGRGKPLKLIGKTLAGKEFSLQDPALRGKIVVIHFWETWCTDGLDEVQRLAEKFKDDVVFVGCNIENDTETFTAYVKKNPDYFTWTHLHSPGSMESSSLAQQLGVPSEPLILIVDTEGNLAEPDVAFSDLEREIERQRRK